MTISAEDISKLRRMVNEPTSAPYTDGVLETYVELYPVTDSEGYDSDSSSWTASYDLNAAAADIWSEKASAVQTYYNFSADGGRYDQNQLYESAMDKVRFHLARRKAGSRYTHKSPKETTEVNNEDGLIYDEAYAWWRL